MTSPYSAALSIPMKGNYLSFNSAAESKAADASLKATLVPGINWPVWAVFLAIYPVISFVLYLATQVIFRYRWWAAGGTG